MIVCKSANHTLEISDLEENIQDTITDGSHIINISYVEEKVIQFVPCFDSFSYLKEMILWLNEQNFPAMIWLNETEDKNKKYDMPFFINDRLCCAYEGELKISGEEFCKYLYEINSQQKKLDNFLNPAMLWLLEKLLTYKDSMAFMNNLGEFTYINTYSRYINQDITYLNYGIPYKNGGKIGFQNHQYNWLDGQHYHV